MHRRSVLAGGAALGALAAVPWNLARADLQSVNLIPDTPSLAPNYWATWAVQNYQYYRTAALKDQPVFLSEQAYLDIENEINEANLFGSNGWAARFYPQIRSDMFLMLDEGWQQDNFFNFEIDRRNFPSFTGTPLQQITDANRRVRALGWRGAGLWCRDLKGGASDTAAIEIMRDAGIGYCKLDGGDKELNLIRERDRLAPQLRIEHVAVEGPFNGDWSKDGRFKLDERFPAYSDAPDLRFPRKQMLEGSDIFRIYDLSAFLSVPTALDRTAQYLTHLSGHPQFNALLNVEDEVYIAAVLGCTMGVMRHPEAEVRPDGMEDFTFIGPRRTRERMDEVVRALRWQRIAGPFPGGRSFIRLDDEILTDSWRHGPFQTYLPRAYKQLVHQGAPARISRDIELPSVVVSGNKPFVFAGRFPNGAVAVGTHQRTLEGRPWFMPEAAVSLKVGRSDVPIGVFGHYGELILHFDQPLGRRRVLAQDLKSSRAVDVTRQVGNGRSFITLTQKLIERIGLQAAVPGDRSSPGLVVKLVQA